MILRTGFKKKRLLNSNYIKSGGGTGPSIDISASLQREKQQDDLDGKCGFFLYNEGPAKLGWLINYNTCAIEDKESGQLCSAVACYFMCQNGDMFKCKLQYAPYFYLQVKDDREMEVEAYLRRKFEGKQNRTASLVNRTESLVNLCCSTALQSRILVPVELSCMMLCRPNQDSQHCVSRGSRSQESSRWSPTQVDEGGV